MFNPAKKQKILDLPDGTLVAHRWLYGGEAQVTIGRKGPAINAGSSPGFLIVDLETRQPVGACSRYAEVEVLEEPRGDEAYADCPRHGIEIVVAAETTPGFTGAPILVATLNCGCQQVDTSLDTLAWVE